MKIEVVAFGTEHYDMDSGQGAKLVIQGDHVNTNNAFGVSITTCEIDYVELNKVLGFKFPAKLKGDMGMVNVKKRSGQSVASLKISNLEFVCSMKLVEEK